jgi:hypothetical protein
MHPWEDDTKQAEAAIPNRIEPEDAEQRRAWKQLNKAQELLVQAYNEWTPTQGPTDEWLRQVKKIKESREY